VEGDKLRLKPHTAARIDLLGRRLCWICVQLVFIDLPRRAFLPSDLPRERTCI